MDFEKLKKAAKETFKIVSSKVEETIDTEEKSSTNPEITEDEKETVMGQTQKIDLKSVLDLFKSKKQSDEQGEEQAPETGADTSDDGEIPEPESEDEYKDIPFEGFTSSDVEAGPEINIPSSDNKVPGNTLAEIDKKLSDFADSQKIVISDITADIAGVKADIEQLKQAVEKTNGLTIARLNNTDSKLNSISNSLAGIAKLNDSIFDLKNSQMNTKNSIGDLEANFYKLKRKMTTGVLLISIITAVIAILEIINLLS